MASATALCSFWECCVDLRQLLAKLTVLAAKCKTSATTRRHFEEIKRTIASYERIVVENQLEKWLPDCCVQCAKEAGEDKHWTPEERLAAELLSIPCVCVDSIAMAYVGSVPISLKKIARLIHEHFSEVVAAFDSFEDAYHIVLARHSKAVVAQEVAEEGCDSGAVENIAAESKRVRLLGQGKPPMIDGQKVNPLSKAAYDVVLALIEAGDDGLTKDSLDTSSGHGDARKTMKRLADSDRKWKSVLSFPGKAGRGYRIL